jgi:glucose-1-phosphate thymidylyltransferase
LEITDALDMLLNENHIITYNMITDYWKDTGTPEDIIHANGIILENLSTYFHGKDDGTNTIEGNIMVGENSIIKNHSTLNGPIIIGKNCIIDGATIGPHTSIGDDSTISNCNLQDSIIMSNCKITGDIKIKNSIISYNASIISNPINIEKTFLLGEGTKLII